MTENETPADKLKAVNRIRWLKRFRPPVLLALLGLACAFAPAGAARFDIEAPDSLLGALPIAAYVFLVGALGWAVTTTVDAFVKRRIGRLNLSQDDNLNARISATRLDVVRRVLIVIGGMVTLAAALTGVPGVRQIGVSLFASAGIAGIAIGLAARPMLSNLIAGLQIAFTQPIRLDDAVVVENEWGWIEEISLFYVVIRLWDWRRLVVPLSYFIEKPFQNWTRRTASIIGTVTWAVDYRAPVKAMRAKLEELCKSTDLWDGDVVNLQVVEADRSTLTIRALASAKTSPRAWDLRCYLREEMTEWLQQAHPEALPRTRAEAWFAGEKEGPPAREPEAGFSRDESLQR